MLWPSRTIWLNAGSRPSGLYIRSDSRSESRSIAAAIGIDTPVGYI